MYLGETHLMPPLPEPLCVLEVCKELSPQCSTRMHPKRTGADISHEAERARPAVRGSGSEKQSQQETRPQCAPERAVRTRNRVCGTGCSPSELRAAGSALSGKRHGPEATRPYSCPLLGTYCVPGALSCPIKCYLWA